MIRTPARLLQNYQTYGNGLHSDNKKTRSLWFDRQNERVLFYEFESL